MSETAKVCVSSRKTLALGIIVLVSGCLSPNAATDCSSCKKAESAKTLFEWKMGGDSKTDDEKTDKKNEPDADDKKSASNGNQDDPKNGADGASKEKKDKNTSTGSDENGKAEDDANPKPIETDRPDFTEASSTVGRGRIQLEAGYTFIRDRDGGVTHQSHSCPEALLRIGLFADWFELRIGQNFSSTGSSLAFAEDSHSGAEDLYLGVKLALTEQKKCLPETALIIQSLVPTGRDGLTASQMLPGVNYLFGWDVIEDCLSCGGSLQTNRTIDDSGHFYTEVAQSFTVGYTLTKRLGAYTEWFAFYPDGAVSSDVGPQHYFDGGFTFKVTDNLQLDVRAGVGVNRHADDFFAGSGFAVRY